MKKRKVVLKAWADIGSHGHIFTFIGGPTGIRYPGLLQIYKDRLTPNLKPITITYELDRKNEN